MQAGEAAEYEVVRGGGAGLFCLSARGRIEVRGTEAVQFLNGLITNDVKTLALGAWMYAALPNAQGRLLALTRVLRRASDADIFLFDTEAATRERVRDTFTRFTLAGDFRAASQSTFAAPSSMDRAELLAEDDSAALHLRTRFDGAIFGVRGPRGRLISWAAIKLKSDEVWELAVATEPDYR